MSVPATRISPPPFLDSNVVLYLLSADGAKADRAERLLVAGAIVSVQVLNEVASVCSRKFRLSWAEIEELLGTVRAACSVLPLTIDTHDVAIAVARNHRVSFFDALIVAAAELAGARTLYTEDLAHGQRIGRVRIVDPFR